jgi:hypothetical protein
MQNKMSKLQDDGTCGKGKYRVQLYSRRAALMSEYCLDAHENNLPSLEAAEHHLRHLGKENPYY